MCDEKEYIIQAKAHFSLGLKELWQYRELFYFFSWRDLKVKYKQTTLGLAWAILQPMAMMSIFVLFFANALNLSTQTLPPAVFYLGALIYWNLFQAGLSHSAESMIANANIVKKIYFPRLIIPISSILVALFDFLVAAVVFVGVLIYHSLLGQLPDLNYFSVFSAMCLALFITLITTFGFGIYLAALTVKYRDFRYIIPFFLQFLFFATPVIYSLDSFSQFGWLQYALAINPISTAISILRYGLGAEVLDWKTLMVSMVAMVFFMILGIYQFRKTEEYFADLA